MLELLAQTTQPDQVRAFYTDAFYAVLTVVVIMVAIFGFAVPLIAGLLQRKSSAKELEQLRQEVRQEMEADREELLQSIREEMKADRERLIEEVRRKMNLDMGRTCEWLAYSASGWRPEFSAMVYLHAARYQALTGDTVSAIISIGNAGLRIDHIVGNLKRALRMKSGLLRALDELKAVVASEGMGDPISRPIAGIEETILAAEPREVGPIEKAIQGTEPREDGGGTDADPAATEDDQ